MAVDESIIKGWESRLNEIQKDVYNEDGCSKENRRRWYEVMDEIKSNGFTVRKRTVKNGDCHKATVWRVLLPSQTRNNECPFIYTDVRPKGRKNLVTDCTTRAMAFCLDGILSYEKIEEMQYELASKLGMRRNDTFVWKSVILAHGYAELPIYSRKVKRSVIASIVKGAITAPIITKSSGHVAVVDVDGAVRDTWDSRGGKVSRLYVKTIDIFKLVTVLNEHGIYIN